MNPTDKMSTAQPEEMMFTLKRGYDFRLKLELPFVCWNCFPNLIVKSKQEIVQHVLHHSNERLEGSSIVMAISEV